MSGIEPSIETPSIDRIAPTVRPPGRAIGFHRWSNLLFVHWRLPVEAVLPLIPAGLTLDTWEGDAWVGLVPFFMSGVRPWWSPAVPGISTFCETNVRTYVHLRGRDPGVWFLSLEAASSLAVRVARWRWHLPYFRAEMNLVRRGNDVMFHSRRLWPGPAGPGCAIRVSLGAPLGESAQGRSLPGTLEHFLIERYVLYAQRTSGRLEAGRVHHAPYPVRDARLDEFSETLLAAARIFPQSPPCHVAFSDGVSVEVFPLRPAEPCASP